MLFALSLWKLIFLVFLWFKIAHFELFASSGAFSLLQTHAFYFTIYEKTNILNEWITHFSWKFFYRKKLKIKPKMEVGGSLKMLLAGYAKAFCQFTMIQAKKTAHLTIIEKLHLLYFLARKFYIWDTMRGLTQTIVNDELKAKSVLA